MQSISVMPIYSDKSHEELRMEDYELRNKGKSLGFASAICCSLHFDK